jgi:hypothetical protein
MFNLKNKKASRLWEALVHLSLASGLRPGPPNDKCPANNDEENNNQEERATSHDVGLNSCAQ